MTTDTDAPKALAITIPPGIRWTMTPTLDGGVSLNLHFSGKEDVKELAHSFIALGVDFMQRSVT